MTPSFSQADMIAEYNAGKREEWKERDKKQFFDQYQPKGQMNAALLAGKMGDSLIGRDIITEEYGDFPGGRCTVYALNLDPEAPEIVINVQHPTWRPKYDPDSNGEMGVFDHEDVVLCPL